MASVAERVSATTLVPSAVFAGTVTVPENLQRSFAGTAPPLRAPAVVNVPVQEAAFVELSTENFALEIPEQG